MWAPIARNCRLNGARIDLQAVELKIIACESKLYVLMGVGTIA